MKLRDAILGASALTAVAGAAAQPAVAAQPRDGAVPNQLAHRYEQLYKQVRKDGGKPGRDIVRDGIVKHGRGRHATGADVRRSMARLRDMRARLTAPPAPAQGTATAASPYAGTSTSTSTSTSRSTGTSTSTSTGSTTSTSAGTATTSGTSSSLPACTWQPESGGDYNAVNSSSGARGKYQIMPSTYAAYGGDGSWSPSDQERVAQRVYAATGGSAWTNC